MGRGHPTPALGKKDADEQKEGEIQSSGLLKKKKLREISTRV